jgi:lipopolysaccharide export LptBFGC system permease protein LptF
MLMCAPAAVLLSLVSFIVDQWYVPTINVGFSELLLQDSADMQLA